MKNIKRAIEIINNSKYFLFATDYDFDGMSCYVIAEEWSKRSGLYYNMIMSNNDHQRGLNKDMVDKICNSYKENSVMITADTGSDAIDAYIEIKKRCPDIKIIVTDHHTIPDEKLLLSTVDVLINPQDSNSSLNKTWCGANVLWELLRETRKANIDDLVGYVSMANLVDQMDMTNGDNISTYYDGQKVLDSYPLIRTAKKDFRTTRHHDRFISIRLAPIINSCHRFGKPELGVRVLKGDTDAYKEASIINARRKKLTNELYAMLKPQIKANKKMLPYIMMCVTYGIENKPYCGLIASKIVQDFNVPAIVLNISNNNIGGSGRTITDFPFKDMIDSLNIDGLRVMGHQGAFGVSAKSSEAITSLATKFPIACIDKNIKYKLKEEAIPIELKDLDNIVSNIEDMRPFGNANSYPMYNIKTTISKVKFTKKTISIFLIKHKENMIEVLYFGQSELISEGNDVELSIEVDIDSSIKLICSEIKIV